MPNLHFLNEPTPLAQQVAGFIQENTGEGTLLITPTTGAARRIVNQLKAAEHEPPKARQPMLALLPDLENLASPVERALAWAEALRQAPGTVRQALFWNRFPETTSELLKAARNFIRLGDRLAEAGLSPLSPELPAQIQGGFDAGRWSAIGSLYQSYLENIQDWGLEEPNALRLAKIEAPDADFKHLVIAAVSDLPRAFERYADQLEKNSTQVDVLIWNPAGVQTSGFDAWGRPEPEIWNTRQIDIDPGQITVAPSAQDEARSAVAALLKAPSDLVVVDPKLQSSIASEILFNEHQPYLPEGDNLVHCQAAKLALEWEEFRHSKDLRRLRRLLELPAFCQALDPENPVTQSDALSAIDYLLGKTIANTLDAGWAAWPAEPADCPDPRIRGKVRRLLGSVQSRLEFSARQILEIAFPETESKHPDSIERVLAICRKLEASPALRHWSKFGDNLPVQILGQAIRNEQILRPAGEDDVSLNGWLEAPWLSAPQIVLCGLIEGQLPKSVDGDPFIPDSICPSLGLSHNRQRLARDSYLLHALMASRPAKDIHLSYSKYNGEGDPNRPSRLLLRTGLDELPRRVQLLTQAGSTSRSRPTRHTAWRWQLPSELPPVERISPTQFESYLSCPFRYCLKHILKLDSGPAAAHEMDAAVFGNLIHITLENFGREVIPLGEQMLRMDEQTIRAKVQALLQIEAAKQFGPNPPPAVRIQVANAEARLHGFARVQAATFAEGWIITEVERPLKADDTKPLRIGPLPLSGTIDRIERHAETGALRIMDYKTFSTPKVPFKTHLAPVTHNWMDEALVELSSGKRSAPKTWRNLQLPLYRRILEHWYPDACKAQPPATAYFLLPSDPNETAITPFEELNESLNPDAYQSAMACAEAVAQRIHVGRFWPPQPYRDPWDDPAAPIFVNGNPEDCIAPESIERLKGGGR